MAYNLIVPISKVFIAKYFRDVCTIILTLERFYTGSHSLTSHQTRAIPAFKDSPAAEHQRPMADTHCAYPRRDDQAEFTWVAIYIPK